MKELNQDHHVKRFISNGGNEVKWWMREAKENGKTSKEFWSWYDL